jgi:hypothetical protein
MHWFDEGYSFGWLQYDFTPEPIPEPATLLLLASGLALVGMRRRR